MHRHCNAYCEFEHRFWTSKCPYKQMPCTKLNPFPASDVSKCFTTKTTSHSAPLWKTGVVVHNMNKLLRNNNKFKLKKGILTTTNRIPNSTRDCRLNRWRGRICSQPPRKFETNQLSEKNVIQSYHRWNPMVLPSFKAKRNIWKKRYRLEVCDYIKMFLLRFVCLRLNLNI